MKTKDKIIRTQQDLDMIRKKENGMFYIAIDGHIATFNGEYFMTMMSAQDRLAQIAAGQSALISESMALGMKKDAMEAILVALQTFMVPYRIH
jgi:hypothetical protein